MLLNRRKLLRGLGVLPLVSPALAQNFYLRNPLAFPSGVAPGFDPNHIAARSCPFSGIATPGGTFGNILSTVRGTEGGTKTSAIYGRLGLITNYLAATNDKTIFPFVSALDAPITLAGIFKKTATGASAQYLLNNAAGGVVGIGDPAADGTFNGLYNAAGSASFATGITYTLERPYFFAASFSTTIVNWAVSRLDTGQVWSASVANSVATIEAGDGTITVGTRSGNARQLDGGIATAMASNAFMSQQQLVQWAADPWTFWYPQQDLSMLVGLNPVSSGLFRTLMGVGQ